MADSDPEAERTPLLSAHVPTPSSTRATARVGVKLSSYLY